MLDVIFFRLLAGTWLIAESCSCLQNYFPEYKYIGFLDYPLVFAFSTFTCGYSWVFKTRMTNSPLLEVSSRVFLVFSARGGIDFFDDLLEWKKFLLPRFLNSQPENERFEWTIFFSGCLLVSYASDSFHIPPPRDRIARLVLLLAGFVLMNAVHILFSILSASWLIYRFFFYLHLPGRAFFSLLMVHCLDFAVGFSVIFAVPSLKIVDFMIFRGLSPMGFGLIALISLIAVFPFMNYYNLIYWKIRGNLTILRDPGGLVLPKSALISKKFRVPQPM